MFGLPLSAGTSERYYQGRQARAKGLPRLLRDARASASTRAEFARGWDDEDLARSREALAAEAVGPEALDGFKTAARAAILGNVGGVSRLEEQ